MGKPVKINKKWKRQVLLNGLKVYICIHGYKHPSHNQPLVKKDNSWLKHECDGCCKRNDFPGSYIENIDNPDPLEGNLRKYCRTCKKIIKMRRYQWFWSTKRMIEADIHYKKGHNVKVQLFHKGYWQELRIEGD